MEFSLCMRTRFAMLSEDVKKSYENEESHYSVGWSHGKEKLQVLFLLLVFTACMICRSHRFTSCFLYDTGQARFFKGFVLQQPLAQQV